ncbi:hippurate hydrolase [Herbaspirillum sp. Sphag1AN]|uniref:M20 aminoacylase family protein n=1 Tax=unclassified Herbaspirillum TaxID=2624150 RepID=UPI0016171317|nr:MULTISPECIES: M20 aminoacylase family protein [unclassified Herbaspirillum]MBB3212349.1 hippurate hydrolase [Herbaspirillum sp. Sphag1AN]MBB3245553.1 hippurate hydrolase [Herbaspirillum sp. Sphag64]
MSHSPSLIPEIVASAEEFIALRHRIHRHPEIGFEEVATSKLVADSLRSWGYEVTTGIGGTGVVGQLKLGNSNKRLGIRADMDALPIKENTGLPYASEIDGKMHACGHDGHTATLLAAAKYLAQTRKFDGTLNLIFQPAEEGLGGAARMIKEGLFELFPCDAVFSLHNAPSLPIGQFALRAGAMAASSDSVTITLQGKGGHGAMPHFTQDPIVAAASIVMGLQTIVSRNIDAAETAVVTVGALQAGTAPNVIPDSAKLLLTIRALAVPVQTLIEERLRKLVKHQAESFNVSAEIEYKHISRVVVNTPDETAFARKVLTEMVGVNHVIPMPTGLLGSEDFSWMLEQVPGCYVLIGNGVGKHGGCMIHNPGYDFNDEALVYGASYWGHLAQAFLTA